MTTTLVILSLSLIQSIRLFKADLAGNITATGTVSGTSLLAAESQGLQIKNGLMATLSSQHLRTLTLVLVR